jgi:hypothetical protein
VISVSRIVCYFVVHASALLIFFILRILRQRMAHRPQRRDDRPGMVEGAQHLQSSIVLCYGGNSNDFHHRVPDHSANLTNLIFMEVTPTSPREALAYCQNLLVNFYQLSRPVSEAQVELSRDVADLYLALFRFEATFCQGSRAQLSGDQPEKATPGVFSDLTVGLAWALSQVEHILISGPTDNDTLSDETMGELPGLPLAELGSLLRYFIYTVQSLVSSFKINPGSLSRQRTSTNSATGNNVPSSFSNDTDNSLSRLQSFLSRFFNGIQPLIANETQPSTEGVASEEAADIGNGIKSKLVRKSKRFSSEPGSNALGHVRHALYWLSVVSSKSYRRVLNIANTILLKLTPKLNDLPLYQWNNVCLPFILSAR